MKTPIVFFGSGPVAAKSLELLLPNFDVIAVVTKPKPEHHRGDFPVIDLAEAHGLSLHLVRNKSELSALISARPFTTELAVLIDFGIIVTKDVIDYFPLGIINSHFSLLPQWRGADPITFSILSGQPKTGVSLMLIDEGMDTGQIIRQKSLAIDPSDTTSTLTDKLILLSNELLSTDIPAYVGRKLPPRSQPHPNRATYSRKLTKEDGEIDWSKPAEVLEREVRAYRDWPKSYTKLADIDVIITSAKVSSLSVEASPGKIFIDNKLMFIGTSKDWLQVDKLQVAGKKEMPVEAFLAGYKTRLV